MTVDLFGQWEAAPVAISAPSRDRQEGIDFIAGDTFTQPGTFTWRINLPADPLAAHARLEQEEEQLRTLQAELDLLPGKFADISKTFTPRQEEGEWVHSGVAFDVILAAPRSLAEKETLRLLGAVEQACGDVNFGLGEDAINGWEQARSQFQDFVDQALHLITHYAWVETKVDGKLLGRTEIGWTGDTKTLWEEDIAPELVGQHQHSLRLALERRCALLKILLTTTQGAVKLSALLTTPGGALLALPAAWRYVNQALKEIEKYQVLS